MSIDPRIRATTPHEETLLDIIARNPDLHISLREDGSVLVTGPGVWVRRDSLGDLQAADLRAPMPPGWDR